jgi:hypothetical protein
MGIGDKFKDIKKQAQGAVAEHKEKIQGAVEVASAAADQKTRGKHTARITKFGQKASDAVEKMAGAEDGEGEAETPDAQARP